MIRLEEEHCSDIGELSPEEIEAIRRAPWQAPPQPYFTACLDLCQKGLMWRGWAFGSTMGIASLCYYLTPTGQAIRNLLDV